MNFVTLHEIIDEYNHSMELYNSLKIDRCKALKSCMSCLTYEELGKQFIKKMEFYKQKLNKIPLLKNININIVDNNYKFEIVFNIDKKFTMKIIDMYTLNYFIIKNNNCISSLPAKDIENIISSFSNIECKIKDGIFAQLTEHIEQISNETQKLATEVNFYEGIKENAEINNDNYEIDVDKGEIL